ncbi:MAG TPA: GAF domain-containing protein [Candidatus Acidoferrales bacterium]|jgi:GAF domain-containing protein|nr:GAF domain-containing protein [Candidatus Acidoferrales bacterium]
MPIIMDNTLNQVRTIAMGGDDRIEKARRLAELVRRLGDYRWVGVYDVTPETVSVIAWVGPNAPESPSFSVSKGLTGAAVQEKRTVICGDVRHDRRYLTSFGSTLSEIIVPVLAPGGETVVGTIGVESEKLNAFSARDQQMIEQCAQAALPLWLLR